MPQPTGISEAEWEVIKVLWERGPLTAGSVVQALADVKHWAPRTVKTMLGRLVKKGAVHCEREEKRYLYRAAISRQAAERREVHSFLARVFDGALVPAVATFIRESDLSADDLAELRKILESEGRR